MSHVTISLFSILVAAAFSVHNAVGQTAVVDTASSTQPAVEAFATDSAANTEHLDKAPAKENTILLLSVLGSLLLFAVSTTLGSKGTLVIYAGWFDFWLSAALPTLFFIHETWVSYVAGLLLLVSFALSCQANRSLLKPLLAFPAKFGLPLLTLLAGILALGSARQLLKGETKDTRDAAMTAATGAACAAGFWFLTRFIRRLVDGELSTTDGSLESNPGNL